MWFLFQPGSYCRVPLDVAGRAHLPDNRGVARTIDPMPALGKAVAARRKAVGKTQEDVAYEADVSLRHLQKIEAGTTNPRLGTLYSIAAVLDMKASRLLEEADGASREVKKRHRT